MALRRGRVRGSCRVAYRRTNAGTHRGRAVVVPSSRRERDSGARRDERACHSERGDRGQCGAIDVRRFVAHGQHRARAPDGDADLQGRVDRADATLRAGDAKRALELTREHGARCPNGSFVQERERVAIEALALLGEGEMMRTRAKAFELRFPSSPHVRRIRNLASSNPE